jgi:hypothetical protein
VELFSSSNANYSHGFSRKIARDVQAQSNSVTVQGSTDVEGFHDLENSRGSDLTGDIHANGNSITHATVLDAETQDRQIGNEEGMLAWFFKFDFLFIFTLIYPVLRR